MVTYYDVKKKQEKFKKAAWELLEVWTEVDDDGTLLAPKYPFTRSFDEICHKIEDWCDAGYGRRKERRSFKNDDFWLK